MSLKIRSLTLPHPDSPFAYVLEIGGFRILLDCGCDSTFDVASMASLREVASEGIHAVLLSQPDLAHLGALPVLVARLGYQGPIYCTVPVAQLGEIVVRTAALARVGAGHTLPFSAQDLFDTFHRRIVPLRYHQPRALDVRHLLQLAGTDPSALSPEDAFHLPASLEVTAFNSGVNLGGSVWRLKVNGEDVLYAPRFSLRAERHLDPAHTLHQATSEAKGLGGLGGKMSAGTSLFSRPLAFLTSAPAPSARQLDPRQQVVQQVTGTLRQGGSVLLPVASVGRLLELAISLGEHWRANQVPFGLALLAPYGERLFGLAKSQLEYAGNAFRDAFQASLANRSRRANQGVINPFLFPDLRLVSDAEGIADLPRGPKVVLAMAHSLEEGPAREVMLQWAEGAQNLLLFVENQKEGTLARQLQDRQPGAPAVILQADILERIPLEGEELVEHQRQREAAARGGVGLAPGEADEEKPRGEGMQASSPSGRAGAASLSSPPGTVRRRGGEGSKLVALGEELQWRSSVLLDGVASVEEQCGPMFTPRPRSLQPPPVDEFGEALLPGELTGYFQEEAYDLGASGPGQGLDLGLTEGDRALQAGDPLVQLLDPDQPFRVTSVSRQVFFSMGVATVDFTATAYDMDLRFAIESVVPRAVMLLRGEWGNPLETARARVQSIAQHQDVRARVEALEAALGPCCFPLGPPSYTLRLGPDVLSRCQPTPRGDCSLGAVRGVIRSEGAGEGPRLAMVRGKRKRMNQEDLGAQQHDGNELFIGDSSSKNVQGVLREAGLTLDFKGSGVLFSAASNILVTAGQTDDALPQLVIEGTLSDEFYRAKKALEKLLKISLE